MKIKNENLSRIPKGILDAENELLMQEVVKTGGSLMLDCLIFLCKHQMSDLFGDAWFSISDFARLMGYKRTNLARKMTESEKDKLFGTINPVHINRGNSKIKHPIETIFEGILYKMAKENISFAVAKPNSTAYNFVQIINYFEIKDDFDTKKHTQRLYKARLNNNIIDILFANYQVIGISDYAALPNKANYKMFYIHLTRMIMLVRYKIEQKQVPCFTITVDELSTILNINIQDNKDRKKKLKMALDSINNTLAVSKFKFEFIKGENQKFAYTVSFTFPDETLNYFNESYHAAFTNIFRDEMKHYYASEILQKRGRYEYLFWENISEKDNKLFLDWLYSEANLKEKREIYNTNFKKAFGLNPETTGMSYDNKKFRF